MAGHLLFFILMYSFHKIQAQDLLRPKLTVNPLVITMRDSVTLDCQTPSSVSVSRCHFRILRGQTKVFSCKRTLTATELLNMSHQRSPGEVEVMCYYILDGATPTSSPQSDIFSISIHNLLPPELTVNPQMITERDPVTLNCQTPSSVSVDQCYFYFGENVRIFSCLKTLTGTELLLILNQSLPAEVKVECFYTVKIGHGNSPSSHSDTSSIIIHNHLPPKLTVNPQMITERDSVTLNCQTPSSVSVDQCYFYFEENVRIFSCLKTLTGTELLLASNQSLPAEVKVKCFYTVKTGHGNSSSHSNTSSIIIRQKPQISAQHFQGDHVLLTCSLPESASRDTKCNLYFGEASDPVQTTNIWVKTKNKQWICQFFVTIYDLLSRLRLVQQHDASCDYSSGSELNSLSPRSDGRSLTDIVEKESDVTSTQSAFTMTKDLTAALSPGTSVFVTPANPRTSGIVEHSTQTKLTMLTTVSRPHASTSAEQTSGLTVGSSRSTDRFISTSPTPVKAASVSTSMNLSSVYTVTDPTPHEPITKDTIFPGTPSGLLMWKLVVLVAGFGVTVGVFSLGLALLCNKRTGKRSNKRTQANVTGDFVRMTNLDKGELLPAGNDEAYSVITSVPGVDCPTGSGKPDWKEPQNADTPIYHLYATISEEPPPSALTDMVYSTVQPH